MVGGLRAEGPYPPLANKRSAWARSLPLGHFVPGAPLRRPLSQAMTTERLSTDLLSLNRQSRYLKPATSATASNCSA
jgi:hypothetical protein